MFLDTPLFSFILIKQTYKEVYAMEKQKFSVPNISCGHCVMTIQRELGEMEGVSNVEGDPNAKEITVDYDAPATVDKIKSTLKEINYPAE
jgi:copper chaperone